MLCKVESLDRNLLILDGGLLDGSLAFDNAISLLRLRTFSRAGMHVWQQESPCFSEGWMSKVAKTKGIKSLVYGRADILIAPNLEVGNIFAKQLEYLGDAVSDGIVLGAKCSIALTSCADTQEVRIASAALCCIYSSFFNHMLDILLNL